MSSKNDIRSYITHRQIEDMLDRLAGEINRDYHDKEPLVIGVLTGSFMFLADLVRKLAFPMHIDFVRLSSYGPGTGSSGAVRLLLEPSLPVEGRDVLLVEDVADTGYSVDFLLKYLESRNPKSVKLCVLADKPSDRKVPVRIDYKGCTAPGKFLVGYGLDYDSKYRNIPDLCILGESGE